MKTYIDGIKANPIAFAVKSADRLYNLHCALVTSVEFKRKCNFIESVGIKSVLNLADSNEDVEKYLANTDGYLEYYRNLYEIGNVIAVDLSGNFYSEKFARSIAEGLTFLAKNETPYCIHCTEGKDRTGYVAMLLEMLTGATLDEIINDYMLSFYNYYGIDQERQPQRYQAVFGVLHV